MSQQATGPHPPPGRSRPVGPDQNPAAARKRQRAAAAARRGTANTLRPRAGQPAPDPHRARTAAGEIADSLGPRPAAGQVPDPRRTRTAAGEVADSRGRRPAAGQAPDPRRLRTGPPPTAPGPQPITARPAAIDSVADPRSAPAPQPISTRPPASQGVADPRIAPGPQPVTARPAAVDSDADPRTAPGPQAMASHPIAPSRPPIAPGPTRPLRGPAAADRRLPGPVARGARGGAAPGHRTPLPRRTAGVATGPRGRPVARGGRSGSTTTRRSPTGLLAGGTGVIDPRQTNGHGGNGQGNGHGGNGGRRGRSRGKKASFLWRYRRVWFLFGVMVVTALAGAAWVLTQVPLPPEAALSQTTIIYDATGNQIATLHGQENRFPVKLDQVPAIVQSAVVAAEDRKFFQHGGIDPLGIARATWADVRHKGATQGGSTITQQYVKQVYVGSDPTLWRKLREAVIAIKLERKLDKRQILERYLNTVYFGRGAYGIQAASRTWFDKDVNQLGLQEAAYLVGLIRSPSAGDVVADPALAYELRTFVLQAMVETKAITPAQMAEVEATKLESYVAERTELDSEVALPGIGAEYYVQYVRQQLEKSYSEDFVLRQGLRVQTSLDPELQRQAYEAVYGLLDEPGDPAGALVAINQDGQVVAMVGGRDWDQSEVNLAVGDEGGGSGRQGGSTFKPFALAAAVKEGYSLESSFRGPAKIILPKADRGNDWEVTNYEGASFGQVNLIDATVDSVNTVYAQLVDSLGPAAVVDTAKQLGIISDLEPVASIALGTQNVSVLEMANAYSTLARGGVRYEPQVITKVTMNDTVLPDTRPKGVRVLEKSQADQVNFALEQVVARGSGTGAQIKNTKVKGKTGTTEDFGDAWFVGSTRSLTVAVWMGYPEGQSQQLLDVHGVRKVNGGSLPARIFQRFLSGLPPENDDTATAAPEFEGRALTPIIRYTTPSATVPEPEPTVTSVPDGSVTLSAPTTTVAEATGGDDPGEATADGDASSTANIDSEATVDTTPATTRPPRTNTSPTFTLPPGVTLPGG